MPNDKKYDDDCLESARQSTSLKELLLGILNERERRYEAHFASIDKTIAAAQASAKEAVSKAEAAVEKRLDGMNEFRGQMADMQATLARKTEVDIRFESLEKKLDSFIGQLQLTSGRDKGIGIGWAVAVALVGLLFGATGIALTLLRFWKP